MHTAHFQHQCFQGAVRTLDDVTTIQSMGPARPRLQKHIRTKRKRVGPLKNIITVPQHTEHLTVLVLLYLVKRSIWLRLGNIMVWSWLGQRNTWLQTTTK